MEKRKSNSRTVLRSIIVATDFSPASASVLAHAASIARRYRSKLYITHIISADVYKSVPPEVMAEALKQTAATIRGQMADVQRLEYLQHVQHDAWIQEGEVAPTLLRLAAEHEVSLLVIGTRGHHGLERLLQGSIAEEVFRMAPCPVLIVPPSDTEGENVPVRTVLYPTTFSESSLRAAPYAFSLARRHRARLILLHVLPVGGIRSRDDFARLAAPVEKRLRELIPDKGAPSLEPSTCVEFGPVAQRILRVAAESQADLIVLGITAAGPEVAHLAEGLTYRILRGAPCPVFTISSKQEMEEHSDRQAYETGYAHGYKGG